MPPRLIEWDSKEGIAQLALESGQEVFVGGSYLEPALFSSYAHGRSFLRLPTKRIWRFAFVTAPKNEQNLVHLDFDEYPPFYALVGYAMQFPSIDDMRWAQGKHAFLFNAEKAFDTLLAIGAIQRRV